MSREMIDFRSDTRIGMRSFYVKDKYSEQDNKTKKILLEEIKNES